MMATATLTAMTDGDRRATQAYGEALGSAFRATAHLMAVAKLAGETIAYALYVERCRVLYKEMQEVGHALITGLMPL